MEEQYKFMMVIVEENSQEKLRGILKSYQGIPKAVASATGMAAPEIVNHAGAAYGNHKIIAYFGIDAALVGGFYAELERKIAISENGRGVAFTVPISSASGFGGKLMQYMMLRAKHEGVKMVKQEFENTHELIVAIVTKGEAGAVRNAANQSGAKGGTMMNGFGLGGEEAAKVLGITMQVEKDVVLIVAQREDRDAIMESIVKNCGIETEARGICFSLPVDSAVGLR